MNQLLIVGRLMNNPELRENEETTITLEVNSGKDEKDILDFELRGSVATSVIEYCREGDCIGIRGKIKATNDDNKKVLLVADKVTFLATKKKD